MWRVCKLLCSIFLFKMNSGPFSTFQDNIILYFLFPFHVRCKYVNLRVSALLSIVLAPFTSGQSHVILSPLCQRGAKKDKEAISVVHIWVESMYYSSECFSFRAAHFNRIITLTHNFSYLATLLFPPPALPSPTRFQFEHFYSLRYPHQLLSQLTDWSGVLLLS